MGRSGGGGGGGHSSGGFGGGHSSGGFSGGGRSSGGDFGRSHSSGLGHSSRSYYSGGYNYRRAPWFGRPRRNNYFIMGPRTWTFIVIIIIIFIILFMSSIPKSSTGKVPKNTTQRTALSGVVDKTDWYDDQIGWISSRSTLIAGLEEFYKKTGIQPYVLLVPYSANYWNGSTLNTEAADAYLETVYSSRFTDEAHFIFAYFACRNDLKTEMDGEFRYLSGYSADTIMDNEAINILWGFFEKNYYNTSLSIEEMIANTFSETAERIMSAPTNGWDFAKVLIIAIAIVAVIIIIYLIIQNKNKREKEKEQHTEKVLNTPLETFGTDTSDLEDKYKDK